MRLIAEDGKQLGVFEISKALEAARQKGLDLIQVTEKVEPPVCRIGDYGKFAYLQKKKGRHQKTKTIELKSLRLTFNISEHDLGTRAKAAKKFLEKGHKVRIEMRLRGRERALSDFAKDKLNKFLEALKESTSFTVERELKREARGFTIIISKA